MLMLDRRELFCALGALPVAAFSAPGGPHSLNTIGVQLYTVRDVIVSQAGDVLRSLDQIGYRDAEVMGASLGQVWPALQQTRLKPISIHLDSDLFQAKDRNKLRSALDTLKQLGFAFTVYPYVPPAERGSGVDWFKALADKLNQTGAECREAGLQFCYHNHAFEFQPIGSSNGWETLLTQTAHDLVAFELDIFWASVAGQDPAALLQRHAGRILLLHVKDKASNLPVQFTESVPNGAFQEAGNGVLDLPRILRASLDAGVKHYFVEQDHTPGDPVASLRRSYEYLRQLRF